MEYYKGGVLQRNGRVLDPDKPYTPPEEPQPQVIGNIGIDAETKADIKRIARALEHIVNIIDNYCAK